MVRTLVCVLGFALMHTVALGGEQVDNPLYASWAKHQLGTSVTYSVELSAGGMQLKNEVTNTLLEVTPEHVIIESKMITDQDGGKQEIDAGTTRLPAKVDESAVNLPPEMDGEGRVTGNATLEVAGESFNCEVVEFKGSKMSDQASGTMHRCLDIPGGLVKLEATGKGDMGENKMTITAISYQVKK